jgi:hypothetical protein
MALSYTSWLFFFSICGFMFYDFPFSEVEAARASRQHLSFQYVAFFLTAF